MVCTYDVFGRSGLQLFFFEDAGCFADVHVKGDDHHCQDHVRYKVYLYML